MPPPPIHHARRMNFGDPWTGLRQARANSQFFERPGPDGPRLLVYSNHCVGQRITKAAARKTCRRDWRPITVEQPGTKSPAEFMVSGSAHPDRTGTSHSFINCLIIPTMCGRYAAVLPAEHIAALFQTKGPSPNWAGTWNMAPTRDAPVIRRHPETGERNFGLLRWGLVPHWIKDLKDARQPINARGETIAVTPMFRDAFARRRCLVPANAFYEWQTTPSGKLPWAIARADSAPLVFAGLWEGWRGAGGEIVRSFAIVTTSASENIRPLHERMPVVLEASDWPLWLGETEGDARGLIRTSGAAFRTWRVSAEVNNVRNDSPSLLDPV